jgi:hypothetical protein
MNIYDCGGLDKRATTMSRLVMCTFSKSACATLINSKISLLFLFAENPPPPYQYAMSIDGKLKQSRASTSFDVDHSKPAIISAFACVDWCIECISFNEAYHATQPLHYIMFRPENGARSLHAFCVQKCVRKQEGTRRMRRAKHKINKQKWI